MPVAKPFIEVEKVVSKAQPNSKEMFELRLSKFMAQLDQNLAAAQKTVDARVSEKTRFIGEIESCFTEAEVKALCQRYSL